MHFELLTPPGPGGVAIVAVRGGDRKDVLRSWLRTPGGAAFRSDPERPRRAILAPEGVSLDDVLVVDRPQLDRLELHLHGSVGVLGELRRYGSLERAVELDAPSGVRGPVCDLLLRATNRARLALALEQLTVPPFGEWLERAAAEPSVEARSRAWQRLSDRSVIARALAEPARLLLVGRQNAGKSTLLNRLVLAERALTGELPGLTRDGVQEEVELSGYPYRLGDTAGLGAAADPLDRAAIERGMAAARGGLRILVVDGVVGWGDVERRLAPDADLVVWTRRDRVPRPVGWPDDVLLGPGFDLRDPRISLEVRERLGRELQLVRGLPEAPADGVGGVVAWTDEELERARGVLLADRPATGG